MSRICLTYVGTEGGACPIWRTRGFIQLKRTIDILG